MDYELELSRIELEQSRVNTARLDMVHQIRQKESEIRRLREMLVGQEAKLVELAEKHTETLSLATKGA